MALPRNYVPHGPVNIGKAERLGFLADKSIDVLSNGGPADGAKHGVGGFARGARTESEPSREDQNNRDETPK